MRFDTRTPRAPRSDPALLLLLALAAAPRRPSGCRASRPSWARVAWSSSGARIGRGQAAIDAVFTEFRRIDALMSTYKPESELSRVNATAATAPVPVSRELYDLLATSIEYSKLTGGAFDVTYASVGYLYDYRARVHPDAEAIAAALPGIDYRHIELDPETRSVRFRQPGVRIDLGDCEGTRGRSGIAVLQGSESTARWSTPAATRASSATASGARGS